MRGRVVLFIFCNTLDVTSKVLWMDVVAFVRGAEPVITSSENR